MFESLIDSYRKMPSGSRYYSLVATVYLLCIVLFLGFLAYNALLAQMFGVDAHALQELANIPSWLNAFSSTIFLMDLGLVLLFSLVIGRALNAVFDAKQTSRVKASKSPAKAKKKVKAQKKKR